VTLAAQPRDVAVRFKPLAAVTAAGRPMRSPDQVLKKAPSDHCRDQQRGEPIENDRKPVAHTSNNTARAANRP